MLAREHYHVECRDRLASHGINIGNRVGSRYLAKPVGIIHRWRNEIHRVDHGNFVRQPIDGCVISGLNAHQKIWISWWGEPFKRVRQIRRTNFGSSAAGACKSGQGFFLEQSHFKITPIVNCIKTYIV